MTPAAPIKDAKTIDLLRERTEVERKQPALRDAFAAFIKSFRKYKAMRNQMTVTPPQGAANVKR